MKVHVFVTMVSKSALKSPNLLPSFTKTAISLNDGITRKDNIVLRGGIIVNSPKTRQKKRKLHLKLPHVVILCGLINDYRSLSNYLKEFSDFIHWYEQMFDRKPFIKKSLWLDWNKLKPDYSGRISTILSNRTTSAGIPLRWFRTLPTPCF